MSKKETMEKLVRGLDDLLESVEDLSLGWQASVRQGDAPEYNEHLDDILEILQDVLDGLKRED